MVPERDQQTIAEGDRFQKVTQQGYSDSLLQQGGLSVKSNLF